MCNFKRMGGREDMCSEAWVKVITAMQDQKNAADICLKEYKKKRTVKMPKFNNMKKSRNFSTMP